MHENRQNVADMCRFYSVFMHFEPPVLQSCPTLFSGVIQSDKQYGHLSTQLTSCPQNEVDCFFTKLAQELIWAQFKTSSA